MKKTLLTLAMTCLVLPSFSQNVGIGTNTPKAKLEVNSTLGTPAIPGTTSNGILRVTGTSTGGLDVGIYTAPWIQAGFNGAASTLSIQPLGGNVGIGTSNPLTKLDVNGILTLNNYELRLRDGNDANHGLRYNATVDGPQLYGYSGGALGTANGTNALKWYAGGYAVINGAIAIDDAAQGDGNLANGLKFGGLSSNEGISSKRTAGGNQGGLDFYTNNQNRLSVSNTGYVGIGTTSPNVKLKVSGDNSGDATNTWTDDFETYKPWVIKCESFPAGINCSVGSTVDIGPIVNYCDGTNSCVGSTPRSGNNVLNLMVCPSPSYAMRGTANIELFIGPGGGNFSGYFKAKGAAKFSYIIDTLVGTNQWTTISTNACVDAWTSFSFAVPEGFHKISLSTNDIHFIDTYGNKAYVIIDDVQCTNVLKNNAVVEVNRNGTDGAFISFRRDESEVGNITLAGNTLSYNAFTGSHYGWSDDAQQFEPGALLIATGKNRQTESLTEAIYGIDYASVEKDNRVLGVYGGILPTKSGNVILVNAVGNGTMLVTDKGGNIRTGDLLCSSARAGFAMKQKDDGLHAYTIAKAMETVNWDQVQSDHKKGFKWKKIDVLFK